MRYGFTTGSSAAAAAKAAAYMLLTGKEKEKITIETPKGIPFEAVIRDIKRSEKYVSCAVEKDGGDDPDITTGALIYATVEIVESTEGEKRSEPMNQNNSDGTILDDRQIHIDGGFGVGRVTKPGLDQPVGNAAINHVPREMIQKEVNEVCVFTDFHGSLSVIISVPRGEEIAVQTFNPRLGIAGGISILGTSGIVEPMSSQSLIDTIRVELSQKKAEGYQVAAVSPGNYGLDYMKSTYGYDLDRSVKCSNFIGLTIDMAVELGFKQMLLTGHIGKLVKVAGGIMNTHSKEGDCRMELIVAAAIKAKTPVDLVEQILDSVTTEEAVRILCSCGKCEAVMEILMDKIMMYLQKRSAGKMRMECIMYSNDFGELAKSSGADEFLELLNSEHETY